MFGDLVRWIKEGDILDKLHGIVGLKKLLIDDATAPYMEVIDANLVPVLINLSISMSMHFFRSSNVFSHKSSIFTFDSSLLIYCGLWHSYHDQYTQMC